MATQPVATTLMTAEDLLALGDDAHYELIEGMLVPMSPAGRKHGRIGIRIGWRLAEFVDERELGEVYGLETGFVLARNPDTVRCPDVAFVAAERILPEDDDGFVEGAPDLAVEIISPSNTVREMLDKVVAYMDAGARQVWLVEPNRKIVTIYAADGTARLLREGDTIDGADVLPGFSLPVAEAFR
jgi:Uma2 family endonuclease